MYTLQSFPQPQPSQSEMPLVADIKKKRSFDLKQQDLGSVSAESQNKKVTFIFLCHSQKKCWEALLCEVQIKLSELN